jgi:hypothetical protein
MGTMYFQLLRYLPTHLLALCTSFLRSTRYYHSTSIVVITNYVVRTEYRVLCEQITVRIKYIN